MMRVDRSKCLWCGGCVAVCPVGAINLEENRIEILDNCTNCKNCMDICPVGAIYECDDEDEDKEKV